MSILLHLPEAARASRNYRTSYVLLLYVVLGRAAVFSCLGSSRVALKRVFYFVKEVCTRDGMFVAADRSL